MIKRAAATLNEARQRGEQFGDGVVLEHYDGPLTTARRVQFPDAHALVQVETVLATVGEPFTIGYDANVREVVVRFDRDDLIKLLAIIDGTPVEDFHGAIVDPTTPAVFVEESTP